MKSFKIISLIVILGCLNFSLITKKGNYQIECISLETDGYISIKIWDTKLGKSYKAVQAQKDAIRAVLYVGIAGTNGCLTQASFLSKSDEIEKFKKIEKDFFSKKGKWNVFIKSSSLENTIPENISKMSWKVYQVSIAKDALRKYLEENQIIKSLKTGF